MSFKHRRLWIGLLTCITINVHSAPLSFNLSIQDGLAASNQTGRLLVILGKTKKPELRGEIRDAGKNAPYIFARDVTNFHAGETVAIDAASDAFPITNLQELPAGKYFAEALWLCNPDLRTPDAPGNFYSEVRELSVIHGPSGPVLETAEPADFVLTRQIPAEVLPAESSLVKFVKIKSKLLSEFYGRPIFLRAGVILPRNYHRETGRKYPLWVRAGGLDQRYTLANSLMAENSDFQKMWMAEGTPQMIVAQLDGAGPLGDPYQINSANEGPYGDAVVHELIPEIEKNYRCAGLPRSRVLSGVSTGGWVSLALQIFYPDDFNGVWSSCPDPVDFRALELIDIYKDENAYVNKYGMERPSDRAVNGDIRLTMRREVALENVLGQSGSYTTGGGQWCDWNAVFGPRGTNDLPAPLWNPRSGEINHATAKVWQKYDLRLVLENNWKILGSKLQGKIHIAVGDADNYFLNNAVHLLDAFLSKADPPYKGRIVYGPGKGHGWSDVTTLEMMKEMVAAAGEGKTSQ